MRVIVVGAGIVGAACARALASAGFITVLERGACAGGTSSSCEGNLLVSDKTPGPELDLAVLASTRWPQLAAELRDQLGDTFPSIEYEPKGGVVVAYSGAAADAPGLRPDPASRRGAGAHHNAGAGAAARTASEPRSPPRCTIPTMPRCNPPLRSRRWRRRERPGPACVRASGWSGHCVTQPATVPGVRTDRADHAADAVVNAAGPWAGEVAALLGAPVPVLPRFGMVLVTPRMPHRVFHKVYDADYVGATQSGDADLQTSAVVESTAAGTVLIGSSRQRVGFDDRLDVRVIAQIAAKASAFPSWNTRRSCAPTVDSGPTCRIIFPSSDPTTGWPVSTRHRARGRRDRPVGGLGRHSAGQLTQSVAPLDPTPFALNRSTLAPHLQDAA